MQATSHIVHYPGMMISGIFIQKSYYYNLIAVWVDQMGNIKKDYELLFIYC
jgi:hypothetical protein